MIKRIVEVSSARTHLAVGYGQLVLKREGKEVGRIPCEDVGVLLVDHQGVTYTHSVFTELLKHGAAVVLCNGSHHPAGMLLPVESNSVQTERYREQINAKAPLKKQLWRQLVSAKIRHQAKVIGEAGDGTHKWLVSFARKVRSGDPENLEAQASKRYWGAFLDGGFRRDVNGGPPNNMLNYGYMVMRAAVARALCSAGLLPSLGIHHRNRYNAFCLADDVVEPFRGYVDSKVRAIWKTKGGDGDMNQEVKAQLLEVLYQEVSIGGYSGPLMVGLHRTAASLERCFSGEQKSIELPEL